MTYADGEKLARKLEQIVQDGFYVGEFEVIEISSLQINENKKGIISVMPVIKLKRSKDESK